MLSHPCVSACLRKNYLEANPFDIVHEGLIAGQFTIRHSGPHVQQRMNSAVMMLVCCCCLR